MFKHILVPLDGSELAESVLPLVESLGKQLDAKVSLVRIVDVSAITRAVVPATPEVGGGFSPEIQSIIDESVEAELKEAAVYLTRAAKRLPSVTTVTEVRQGIPAEELVEAINSEGVDAAVVATHGRSGISRTIFGSVADHLIRESGKPIIVVKPKQD
ncbi:MAG: universal stress protein [Dehalococcoidia bacterium]